jgi:hypothetical protein
MTLPRISFGIIVLNGNPFVPYTLSALYPFAHEILVVEGAAPSAVNIATKDGHSKDGTLEALCEFKENHDPENKIKIITAESEGHPNGFWPGEKDQQSQAYAKHATGDYLWQVDIDEFYQPQDMEKIIRMLQTDPEITHMSFKQITFWGGLDYWVDGPFLQKGADIYNRLFKWGSGYTYKTHRPPTVLNEQDQDVKTLKSIGGNQLAKQGVYLYHYSLLLPKQVQEKCEYYGSAPWAARNKAQQWAVETYGKLKQPFRVHNVYDHISWLERYTGNHPEIVKKMMQDLETKGQYELRDNKDIEKLLSRLYYRAARFFLKRFAVYWK